MLHRCCTEGKLVVLRRSENAINFTKSAIEKVPRPNDGRVYYYDQRVPGLALCVTASGSKSFYLARRIGRKYERVRIGAFPQTTVEQARNEATALNGAVVTGENPAESRRVERAPTKTLRQVFDEFIELPTRTKRRRRPKSPKTKHDYRQQFNAYLKLWHDSPLTAINKGAVEELHNQLAKSSGQHTGNRVVVLLKVLFNLAIEQKWFRAENPAVGIVLFEEHSRERFLQPSELPKFWAALEAEPSEKVKDAIKVLLWTGQRRMNVLEMKWADVNISDARWTLNTKTGPHSIPLPAAALEILTRRYATKGDGEYVFPGLHGRGHLQDIMRQWKSIREASGLHDLRPHDLRRSLGSWQVKTGASLPIIGKTLGHRQAQTTMVYSRVDVDPVLASMEAATGAMLAAAQPGNPPKSKRKGRSK